MEQPADIRDAGKTSSLPPLQEIQIPSTLDGAIQNCLYWTPASPQGKHPLLVFLHTWGGNYQQKHDPWQQEAVQRGWAYLHPDFRGPNIRPEACGSVAARQDVIDALDWALTHLPIDADRVYLAGGSGGGHMAMLMAAYFPQRFAAVSQWCGICDLAAWCHEHTKDGQPQFYAKNIIACVSGIPGSSPEVDRQLRDRSPVHHLTAAKDLPIDFAHGIHDGHTGSVPIHHSVDAFNVIARAQGVPGVSPEELAGLSQERPLSNPQPQDRQVDPTLARTIYLRRHAGRSRLTIFEGGHESFAAPACAWLSQFRRSV